MYISVLSHTLLNLLSKFAHHLVNWYAHCCDAFINLHFCMKWSHQSSDELASVMSTLSKFVHHLINWYAHCYDAFNNLCFCIEWSHQLSDELVSVVSHSLHFWLLLYLLWQFCKTKEISLIHFWICSLNLCVISLTDMLTVVILSIIFISDYSCIFFDSSVLLTAHILCNHFFSFVLSISVRVCDYCSSLYEANTAVFFNRVTDSHVSLT